MHIEATSESSDFLNKKDCFTVFKKFEIFRRILDAKMKDVTHVDEAPPTKREEKEAVSDELPSIAFI